eukprot:CAMPEP_0118926138 /NCGR_PEP_ID=MMETSP1169-20130426/3912_1 /TAXON_ID=36882 /ORGANISM="Pyramimonas obovata, Strain CCMP722" /LENGTH=243 /DNA_ID=CAMNT_0006867635 /DNA_START=266 /DNA_END=997 /DNA_ORIENTATION=-
MSKYNFDGNSTPEPAAPPKPSRVARKEDKSVVPYGTFLILLLNLGIFLADHVLHLPFMKGLYLYHDHARWFQFVTNTFCHAGWEHLSNNIFFLYIFGKLVEEEEGTAGVWLTYLVTGVGASLASYLLLPGHSAVPGLGLFGGKAVAQTVSLGASGAVFGLFAVSVLVKLSRGLKLWTIMESFILGQFVVKQIMSEVKMQMVKSGSMAAVGGVNHIAHLAGALAGVLLIWLLSRLPGGGGGEAK